MTCIIYGVDIDTLISKTRHINKFNINKKELEETAKNFVALGFEFDTVKQLLSHENKRGNLLDYLYKLKITYQI